MKVYLIIIAAAMLFIISCASVPVSTVQGPTGDLAETVKTYYDLRMEGRLNEAWTFERRSLIEDPKTREEFRAAYMQRESGFVIKKYEILNIGKEGKGIGGFTSVMIRFTSKWPASVGINMPEGDRVFDMEDAWEKINGRWYHIKIGTTGDFY